LHNLNYDDNQQTTQTNTIKTIKQTITITTIKHRQAQARLWLSFNLNLDKFEQVPNFGVKLTEK